MTSITEANATLPRTRSIRTLTKSSGAASDTNTVSPPEWAKPTPPGSRRSISTSRVSGGCCFNSGFKALVGIRERLSADYTDSRRAGNKGFRSNQPIPFYFTNLFEVICVICVICGQSGIRRLHRFKTSRKSTGRLKQPDKACFLSLSSK